MSDKRVLCRRSENERLSEPVLLGTRSMHYIRSYWSKGVPNLRECIVHTTATATLLLLLLLSIPTSY